MGPEFSIVIPCFNEESGLPKTINDILNNVKGEYEIIIVDDGSSDGTYNIAEELAKKHEHIRVYKHVKNKGKRHAIDLGTKTARSDIIVHIDGDFTYPAKYINPLVDLLNNGYNMVYGSRFKGEKAKLNWLHKFGNFVFAQLFNFLYFKKITDLTSGLRVLKKNDYLSLGVQSPNFGLETELMTKAARSGWVFAELPITLRERKGERKLKTFSDGYKILKLLLKNRF